jgi:hypothetical protein
MAEQQDSAASRPARDWALHEKPAYKVEEIIRHWCEIPDGHRLILDRATRLPLPDPAYPFVAVRTALLRDALDRRQLGHEVAEKHRDRYSLTEGIQWKDRVVRSEALKEWFKVYRRPERPAFLFWREDGEGPPKPPPQEESADPGDIQPAQAKPGRKPELAMLEAHIDALTLMRTVQGMTQAEAVERAIALNYPEAHATVLAQKRETLDRRIPDRWKKLKPHQ